MDFESEKKKKKKCALIQRSALRSIRMSADEGKEEIYRLFITRTRHIYPNAFLQSNVNGA